MSSDEGDAAALRAQLTAMTAERDAALARAEAAEAEAAAALQRVASLEQLLARGSDSGDAAADELLLLDDSDADAAEADTAVAGPPLNPPARRPGDLERQYGDAAAEPPASQAVNPFARAFDPAQEVREQYAAAQAVLAQRAANAAADAVARKRELEAEERLASRNAKRTGHQHADDEEDAEEDAVEDGCSDGGGTDAARAAETAPGKRRIVKAKRPVLPAGVAEAAPNPFASIVIAPPPAAQ